MAKFHGRVGYAETVEVRPGVWEEQLTEHTYYGDVIRNTRSLQSAGQVNDNITVSCDISILADPFANQHFHAMRYVEFMGALWKIDKVDPQPPRLILTLGGVYNGKQA
jgi:hypothetical protein